MMNFNSVHRYANLLPIMNDKQHGFTLIEAIVALVLIATTGMALFSWINSNIITLNRVREINAKNAATINVIEYMNSINPMITPDGQANLASYHLYWKAKATETRNGVGYPYGVSLYKLGLYQTKINVRKSDMKIWFTFTLQQVGYKKVRSVTSHF